jgi:hypothetical protein
MGSGAAAWHSRRVIADLRQQPVGRGNGRRKAVVAGQLRDAGRNRSQNQPACGGQRRGQAHVGRSSDGSVGEADDLQAPAPPANASPPSAVATGVP